MKNFAVAASAAACLLALATGCGSSSAHATNPTTRTVSFVLHFEGPTSFVDSPPKARGFNPGPGDTLTSESLIFDSDNRHEVGHTSELCTVTVAKPFTMECSMSLVVGASQLVVAGAANPSHTPWTMPVTGGTGRYANATGNVRVTSMSGTNERWTFTLAG